MASELNGNCRSSRSATDSGKEGAGFCSGAKSMMAQPEVTAPRNIHRLRIAEDREIPSASDEVMARSST